ncbi:hypothetical protein EON63_18030 [archaeon]|nr:MAG: hypothetical protein EON63_18030 [archaeon]
MDVFGYVCMGVYGYVMLYRILCRIRYRILCCMCCAMCVLLDVCGVQFEGTRSVTAANRRFGCV